MISNEIQDHAEFEKVFQDTLQKAEASLQDHRAGKIQGYGPWGGIRSLEQMIDWAHDVKKHIASNTIPDRNTRNRKTPVRILNDGWDPSEPIGTQFGRLASFWIGRIDQDLP